MPEKKQEKQKENKGASTDKAKKPEKDKRELSSEDLDKVSGGGIPTPKHHSERGN